MFLGCDFSRRTWLASSLGIRSGNINSAGFKDWLTSMFNNKNVFVKILIFAWAIYTHRNEVRFKNKQPQSEEIIRKWVHMCEVHQTLESPKVGIRFRHPRIPSDIISDNAISSEITWYLSWVKDHRRKINHFGAFHIQDGTAYLQFYYQSTGNEAIIVTSLIGIRNNLLHLQHRGLSGALLFLQKGLITSKNFKKIGYKYEVVLEDTINICRQNHYMFHSAPHNYKLSHFLCNFSFGYLKMLSEM